MHKQHRTPRCVSLRMCVLSEAGAPALPRFIGPTQRASATPMPAPITATRQSQARSARWEPWPPKNSICTFLRQMLRCWMTTPCRRGPGHGHCRHVEPRTHRRRGGGLAAGRATSLGVGERKGHTRDLDGAMESDHAIGQLLEAPRAVRYAANDHPANRSCEAHAARPNNRHYGHVPWLLERHRGCHKRDSFVDGSSAHPPAHATGLERQGMAVA